MLRITEEDALKRIEATIPADQVGHNFITSAAIMYTCLYALPISVHNDAISISNRGYVQYAIIGKLCHVENCA